MSEALYRKYRPQIFEDVVGQEHIERTIKNAIEQDKVSHAYLFCGPRGTGKTTTARLLAKALLCQKGPTPEPDGTCEDCQLIAAGTHPDVYELDAASRTGVENVREEIIGRVQFAPTRGRYKVYIIDEVHMLSTAAFNALLKTLEEPPSHVVFILATTDPQKVPETILSRCQRFDFRRISNESIVSRLGAVCMSEGVEFEGEALDVIAHKAEGGMRNALTSLEQLIAFGEGKVTLAVAERMLGGADSSDLTEVMRALAARDAAACFNWVADYAETGADILQFARDLAAHVRNLYVMSLAGTDVALDVSAPERRELEAELPQFGSDRLARMLAVLGDAIAELKTSTNPRLTFEIALTRLVRPDGDLTLASLAERVEALERGAAAAGTSAVPGVQSSAQPGAGALNAPSVQGGRNSFAQDARDGVGRPSASRAGSPVPARVNAAAPVAGAQPPAPAAAGSASAAPASVSAGAAEPTSASTGVATSTSVSTPMPAASASVPAAPQGLGNPAALQRMWQQALAILKKNKAAHGVLFLNTKVSFDAAANQLNIQFPAANTFAFTAVQRQDVRDAVAAALQQVNGQPLNFAYTQEGGASAAGAAAAPSPAAASRPAASAPQRATQLPVSAPQRAAQTPASVPRPAASATTSAPQAPTQHAPAPAVPVPDEVPLDVYDQVPYRQADGSYVQDDAPVAPASVGPAAAPAAPTAGAQNVSRAPEASASAEPSPEEVQAMLAAGFGSDVVFKEVDE